MTNEAILAILKFAGPVVGLVSALWSTTQKITWEGEDGVKRLTLQGRVMVGIIIASTAISILALGFESVIRQQQAEAAADRESKQALADAAKARAEQERQAQRRAERAQRSQAEALARLEADARESKRFLEQRFLILGAAAEQQRRAAQISQQVAREANRRLADAARSFAEFERINYPLRSLSVSIRVALNLEGVDLARFWERLEAMRQTEGFRWFQERRGEPAQIVTFDYKETGRPGLDIGQNLRFGIKRNRFGLHFFPPGGAISAAEGGAEDEMRPADVTVSSDAPIKFSDVAPGEIEADIGRRTIVATFVATYTPAVEGVVGTGEKLSLGDVDRLVPILSISRLKAPHRSNAPDTLLGVTIEVNGQARFAVSPGFRIAGDRTFILSARRR